MTYGKPLPHGVSVTDRAYRALLIFCFGALCALTVDGLAFHSTVIDCRATSAK